MTTLFPASRHRSAPTPRRRRPVVAALVGLAVFACCLSLPGRGSAQQQLSIAATVNDQMISLLDVEARLLLSIQLADLPDTPDTRRRLIGQTLRSIIDEKLKLQEGKQFEITASREELRRAEENFELRAGLEKGGLKALLTRLNLDLSSFLERLESQIVWSKLVSRRYLPTITVSEKEVDDYLAELERNKGKPEYLISEIFLPVDSKRDRGQTRALATRLIQQISGGARFEAIARNFSQNASAATGGNLGWHAAGQLPRELDTVVQRLAPGQISSPVETFEGYYILRLEAKRTIDPFRENAPPAPVRVTLHQAHFPLPEGAADSLIAETMAKARQLVGGTSSCDAFDAGAKQSNSPLSGKLGTFAVNELSEQLQSLVTTLSVAQPSAPVRTADGVIVVMVCDRSKPPERKPVSPEQRREDVREELITERLGLAAEQYLRNLRRTAIVDIRL